MYLLDFVEGVGTACFTKLTGEFETDEKLIDAS